MLEYTKKIFCFTLQEIAKKWEQKGNGTGFYKATMKKCYNKNGGYYEDRYSDCTGSTVTSD